jgi:transcriptional regulator with XRE-family HTH domain
MSKRGQKRNPTQRAAHRREIARMTLQGKFQEQIAEELGISQSQVSIDLKSIREEWHAETAKTYDEFKAQEIAKIDNLERERWTAWNNTTEHEHLGGVQWCIDRRIKVYGIDAAVKLAPTTPDGKDPYDPLATAKDRLISKLAALVARTREANVSGGVE